MLEVDNFKLFLHKKKVLVELQSSTSLDNQKTHTFRDSHCEKNSTNNNSNNISMTFQSKKSQCSSMELPPNHLPATIPVSQTSQDNNRNQITDNNHSRRETISSEEKAQKELTVKINI